MIGEFLTVDELPAPKAETVTRFDRAELLRRQVAAGQTLEDMVDTDMDALKRNAGCRP